MAIGIFDEYTMLNYLDVEAANPPVRDLRVIQATPGAGTLTATLRWTTPVTAAFTTIRYAHGPITAANWDSAVPLAASLPGSQNSFIANIPYSGGSVYFALKTQNAQGDWSDLSNNAFWPAFDIRLPLVRK